MTKNSRGPWRARGTYIYDAKCNRIAYMASRDEQALKDARLIAAAPEMYNLLVRILAAPDVDAYLDSHNEIYSIIDILDRHCE